MKIKRIIRESVERGHMRINGRIKKRANGGSG